MENNIKKLWGKQLVPAANPSDTFRKIDLFKRRGIKRIVLLNTVLCLTMLFVLYVWMCFEPQLVSTKVGITLTILPISIVFLLNCRILPLYKKTDECCSNLDYLNNLLAVKSKEHFMQTKVMNVYFLLLSAGIGLYMYEYTFKESMTFGIVAYIVFILWIGFNWFFLRPRIIRKNTHEIDSLIQQIEKVKLQLKDNPFI